MTTEGLTGIDCGRLLALISNPSYLQSRLDQFLRPVQFFFFIKRTFVQKSTNIDNFIKLLLHIANELFVPEMQK